MPDIVDPATRSRMMAGIRNRDTRPELVVRSLLHRAGFRFRLHVRDLPGRPDIVLPRFRAVVVVNGCFWHRHDCPAFRWPGTNVRFWSEKLAKNVERDQRKLAELRNKGWRTAVVWECAVRNAGTGQALSSILSVWLRSNDRELSIP